MAMEGTTTESEGEPQAPRRSLRPLRERRGRQVSRSVPGTQRRASGTCGRSAVALSSCLHTDLFFSSLSSFARPPSLWLLRNECSLDTRATQGKRDWGRLSWGKKRSYTMTRWTKKIQLPGILQSALCSCFLCPTPRMLLGPYLQVLRMSLCLPASDFHPSVIFLSLHFHNHIFLVLLDIYFFLILQKEDHRTQR